MNAAGTGLDDLQRRVLMMCAEWAAAHPSVATIYVFGSVARGDYGPASDVDLFVRPQLDDISDHSLVEDFTQLHGEADGFSILLDRELRRDVHIHGMVLREPKDHAWAAIAAASTAGGGAGKGHAGRNTQASSRPAPTVSVNFRIIRSVSGAEKVSTCVDQKRLYNCLPSL